MNDDNARINYLTSLLGSAEAELEQANRRCGELVSALREIDANCENRSDQPFVAYIRKTVRAAIAHAEAA